MIGLARTLGRRVVASDGRAVGRLRDLSIEYGQDHPVVRRLIVTGPDRSVPWSAVEVVDEHAIVVRTASAATWPSATDGEAGRGSLDLLLRRDVLDTQIIDVAGRRVSRVGDVVMAHLPDGGLEVVAAEIGARPVIRRILPRGPWLASRRTTVDWADLHLTSDRGHEVQLSSEAAAMRRLGPDGLAHLLTELNVDDAADVAGVLGAARTAGALARIERRVAARILLALGPARAAAVVDELPTPARERLSATMRRLSPSARRPYSRFDGWRRRAPANHATGHDGAA